MTPDKTETLGLRECAERLSVHYMTVYRYVRTGMLPATKSGSEWRVSIDDLEVFTRGTDPSRGRRRRAPWDDRLRARLLAGDLVGAWKVVEGALSAGMDISGVFLEVVGPSMRAIGDGWAEGSITVAEEHRATEIAMRIASRLGSRFERRGRRRGVAVVGGPAGERHRLPVMMVADLLRGAGFDVVDLGVDMPLRSFVDAAVSASPVFVGVSVTNPDSLDAAASLVEQLKALLDAPVLLGGQAIRDQDHARLLGADGFGSDGRAAVAYAESLL